MDTDTVHSVVASNFQRSYRVISSREKEINALPADVRKFVEKLSPAQKPCGLPAQPKAITEPEEPPVANPLEWVKDAVKAPQRSREEVMAYLLKGGG